MLKVNRRKFISNAAATATGVILGSSQRALATPEDPVTPSAGAKKVKLMEEVMKYRKIDSHAHVYFTEDSPRAQIDFADRLGIEKLMISRPMAPGSEGLPKEFRECNDLVLRCVRLHPDRFIGMLTLNPTYKKESMDEIKRCVDQGMMGLKLYNHVKINDPLFYPIIEKFIDLKMIILMHSPIGNARVKLNAREPKNISLPENFVDIAKRYPEQMFQFAHIGGGIDWEYACKTLEHSPNIYVDVSGSNNAANMIDFAMNYIGEDRLLFACDNSFYPSVGGMISARLTDAQRRKIFFDNYNSILKKGGKHVN